MLVFQICSMNPQDPGGGFAWQDFGGRLRAIFHAVTVYAQELDPGVLVGESAGGRTDGRKTGVSVRRWVVVR